MDRVSPFGLLILVIYSFFVGIVTYLVGKAILLVNGFIHFEGEPLEALMPSTIEVLISGFVCVYLHAHARPFETWYALYGGDGNKGAQ